jgi:hypothetical protein
MTLYDRVMVETLDAGWEPDYERDTVHPKHFVGVIRSTKDSKDKLDPWEHKTHETLPKLADDHVRLLHRTGSERALGTIREKGLHFGHHGMLHSTALAFANPKESDYAPPDDHRFKHGHTVVMDVPMQDFQKLTRRPIAASPLTRKQVTAPPPVTRPTSAEAPDSDIW